MIVTLEDLDKIEPLVAEKLGEKTVFLVSGEMGAGKTTLVSCLVRLWGADFANSPTFALHNVYTTKYGEVDHLDLYRIAGEEELSEIGFWDLLTKPRGILFVEWPERLPEKAIPNSWRCWQLRIEFTSLEGERLVRIC